MAQHGVNKVILVGNLGQDPEIRYMQNGKAVANLSIATSESWNDQQGQKQERTEWHNITMYRRLAEIAGQYLKKGSSVYIEGRIQSRKYTGKEGIERTAYDIIGSEMKMLGGRTGGAAPYDEGAYSQQSYQSAPAPQQNYQSAPAYAQEAPSAPPAAPARRAPAAPAAPAAPVDDIDDDIPF